MIARPATKEYDESAGFKKALDMVLFSLVTAKFACHSGHQRLAQFSSIAFPSCLVKIVFFLSTWHFQRILNFQSAPFNKQISAMPSNLTSVGIQQTIAHVSPFGAQAQKGNRFGSGILYPGGLGGATDLCSLYPFDGFNPCGVARDTSCPNYLLYLIAALVILALLFLEIPQPS